MLSPTPLLGWGLHTLTLLLCSSALGFRELHNAGSLVSENMSSRNCPKRGGATPRPWIWAVYEGQNGPNSTVSVSRKATLQERPRLFGQFLAEISFREPRLSETELPRITVVGVPVNTGESRPGSLGLWSNVPLCRA